MSKKTFDLDKGVNLPQNVTSVERDEGILYIAKFNPSFILVDDLESKILQGLLEGKTIREAATNSSNPLSETEKAVRTLLEKIERHGFYEGANKPQDQKWPMHLYLTNRCN